MNEATVEPTEGKAGEETKHPARSYAGLPLVFIAGDPPTPAPFLMSRDEVIRFLH